MVDDVSLVTCSIIRHWGNSVIYNFWQVHLSRGLMLVCCTTFRKILNALIIASEFLWQAKDSVFIETRKDIYNVISIGLQNFARQFGFLKTA